MRRSTPLKNWRLWSLSCCATSGHTSEKLVSLSATRHQQRQGTKKDIQVAVVKTEPRSPLFFLRLEDHKNSQLHSPHTATYIHKFTTWCWWISRFILSASHFIFHTVTWSKNFFLLFPSLFVFSFLPYGWDPPKLDRSGSDGSVPAPVIVIAV